MSRQARRLRLLHVVLALNHGGTEKIVLDVVNGLPRQRFASAVLCLDAYGARRHEVRDDVPVYCMARRPGLRLENLAKFARILAAVRPDVVHFRNFTTYLWGCAVARLWRGVRVIYSDHGNIAADVYHHDHAKLLARRLLRPLTHRLLTNSENFRHLLARCLRLDPAAIAVIPNGVDTQKFYRLPAAQRQALRQQWGYGQDAFVIGIVASLRPVKNIALVIRALPALLAQLPQAQLALVGEGELEEELRRLAAALGVAARVRFHGRTSQVNEALNCFDVLVLPSAYGEGMPNAVLEAMAAQVPVVASAIPGNAEALGAGSRGFLFPPDDPCALVARLLEVAREPSRRKAKVQAAYAHVLAHLTLPRMLARYAALYREVAGGAAGKAKKEGEKRPVYATTAEDF
ncbi:MAG: hypothetical protein KatS3mg131_3787 [Candidatus Tectimicrobiota bacterium]|nr:MAG: hypothetical protein KatS3mg131_3787 [Candidatus Tectomicrobia bacterium]